MSKLSSGLKKMFGVPELRLSDYFEIRLKPGAVERAKADFFDKAFDMNISPTTAKILWAIVAPLLLTNES